MIRYIVHNRIEYFTRTTISDISVNGEWFCYGLEDTLRPFGVKVDGETAIPANANEGYSVGIRRSPAFDRDMLVLYTEPDRETIKYSGVKFKYVYPHGGNDHANTEGCILVAYKKSGNTIFETAEHELFKIVKEWLDEGDDVRWVTTNTNIGL